MAAARYYGTGRRKSSVARVYLVLVAVRLQLIRETSKNISVLKH